MTAPKKQSNKRFFLIVGGVFIVLLIGVFFLFKFLMSNEGSNRQKKPQMVTLIAPPPPPPKVEEKIPEPEKQEEKIEQPEEKPDDKPEPPKEAPAQKLGLDANAGLGNDGFGLEARRGGSNLIGGGGAGSPFAWYAGQLSNSLQKTANDIIQREGGVPPGKWEKVSFEVTVDVFGKISKYAILKSSGNPKIDDAVKKALQSASTFEPPPPGMPKVLRFAVSLQG